MDTVALETKNEEGAKDLYGPNFSEASPPERSESITPKNEAGISSQSTSTISYPDNYGKEWYEKLVKIYSDPTRSANDKKRAFLHIWNHINKSDPDLIQEHFYALDKETVKALQKDKTPLAKSFNNYLKDYYDE